MTETAHPTPPKGRGPLAKREARLAWGLLAPTILIVALVVVLPLIAVFWISVKPVKLSDLRAAEINVSETIRGRPSEPGDAGTIRYTFRNLSPDQPITEVSVADVLPPGLELGEVPEPCVVEGRNFTCDFGTFEPAERIRIEIPVTVTEAFLEADEGMRDNPATWVGNSKSVLVDGTFTWDNFRKVFDGDQFWAVVYATLFYTIVGTIGALVVGLFAALLLNKSFKGQGILRGLYLFPYVAPVIAVAFAWVILLDPFSGSANALLVQMGVVETPINFFGVRSIPLGINIFGWEPGFPLALFMVTVFEIWRYFPLSFLFILARMQSIDTDMYEAADMDGASPFQQFRYLSLPMLLGILSILFLLRFIWTFNKFDDIFLLTGGNADTRTLTVSVYEEFFALENIGAGAAVAVVIFGCLLIFSIFFLRYISREEGL